MHAGEMEAQTRRIEEAIASAKVAKDGEKAKAFQKELTAYQREMAEKIAAQSRNLLKQRFPYPIFLYEAEKVGITATGEPNQNELYPNDRLPPGCEKTCVEIYREFRSDPTRFFVHGLGK